MINKPYNNIYSKANPLKITLLVNLVFTGRNKLHQKPLGSSHIAKCHNLQNNILLCVNRQSSLKSEK